MRFDDERCTMSDEQFNLQFPPQLTGTNPASRDGLVMNVGLCEIEFMCACVRFDDERCNDER